MPIWISPKTDWKIAYDEQGNYTGDYFEPNDYNRIKNNIAFLRDYAKNLYDNSVDYHDLGEDVFYGSKNELKASWWKSLQENLEQVNEASTKLDLGTKAVYQSNEAGYLVDELNRIERVCHTMHEMLVSIWENKRRLSFGLGSRKGVIC